MLGCKAKISPIEETHQKELRCIGLDQNLWLTQHSDSHTFYYSLRKVLLEISIKMLCRWGDKELMCKNAWTEVSIWPHYLLDNWAGM